MGIRDTLKKREENRNKAAGGGSNLNEGLPEGVTRYVKMGGYGEVNSEGKQFVILADPDNWFAYFVHEDKKYVNNKTTHFFKKHTCLNSPKKPTADITPFEKANGAKCLSCKAKARRKMYFIIPVYDPEYKTWRVIDTAEFHAANLISDYDKAEKGARKFNKQYVLVGDAIFVKQVDKSYSLELGTLDEEVVAEAQKFLTEPIPYEELANFRDEDDIRKIIEEADAEHVDKSVLGSVEQDEILPLEDDEDPTSSF